MAVLRLPAQIIAMEADREMRLHHMLWHTARNGWLRFPPQTQQAFDHLGWAPPRPAIDADKKPILTNRSGEDFLFMHRQMIAAVNERLAEIADPACPKIEGWDSFPALGDADFPVPPEYTLPTAAGPDPDLVKVKSDDFFTQTFQPRERRFTDVDNLRSMSLGELGAKIEFSVHNWAHRRWAKKPAIVRPNASGADPAGVDPRFDALSYDWLEDFYSSHVNPTFWKLHGWVDDRIDGWMAANGVAEGEFEWTGTWTGPKDMHDMHAAHAHPARPATVAQDAPVSDAERLLQLAAEAGVEASPRDAALA